MSFAVKCDGCDKYGACGDPAINPRTVPDGWFFVQWTRNRDSDGGHFCAISCIAACLSHRVRTESAT